MFLFCTNGKWTNLAAREEIAEKPRTCGFETLHREPDSDEQLARNNICFDEQAMIAPKPTMPAHDSTFPDTPTELWKRKHWIAQLHHQIVNSRLDIANDTIASLRRRLSQYEGGRQQHSERDLVCVESVPRQGRVCPQVLIEDSRHSANVVQFNAAVTISFETQEYHNIRLGDQEIQHNIVSSNPFYTCPVCHLVLPFDKEVKHVRDCAR